MFDLKLKIRRLDAPNYAFTHRNLPGSEKYIWMVKNLHEKSRFFYISITRLSSRVQPDTRLSPFLRRQSSFSSAASHQCLWDIAAWLAVIFFLDIIGWQKHIATYNFYITFISYRLLAAGNKTCKVITWYLDIIFFRLNLSVCPSVRPSFCSSVRKLFTFSSFSPEPLGLFQRNLAQSIIGLRTFNPAFCAHFWTDLLFLKFCIIFIISHGKFRFYNAN